MTSGQIQAKFCYFELPLNSYRLRWTLKIFLFNLQTEKHYANAGFQLKVVLNPSNLAFAKNRTDLTAC